MGDIRGGGYRITDASGNTLRDYLIGDAPISPSTYVRDIGLSHNDKGNYLVFRGLTAASINVEATTEQPWGNVRAPLNAIQLVAAALDTTPPTAPNDLAASELGSRHVALKWTASTEAGGMVVYEVQRDGTTVGKVLTPAYLDVNLTPKTAYTYRVRAIDESQNTSTWAQLPVTTIDDVVSNGYLKFEYWTGMDSGTAVYLLTDWIAAGNAPNLVSYTPAFDSRPVFPDDSHEQYGAIISGWLTPTESGAYTFFLRSDDASELWLSTDDKEANLVKIAEQTGCCNAFTEPDPANPGSPAYTSAPINLTANKKYFVKLLYKEGGGGDYGQVAWRKAGDTTPAASLQPIPAPFLSCLLDPVGGSVKITRQPVNATAAEGTTTTLSLEAQGTSPYVSGPTYQWSRNGKVIPGATGPSYTTPELTIAADDGAKYSCLVQVPGASVTSAEITLTVVKDTAPPRIAKLGAGSVGAVVVGFHEPLDKASAETPGNYSISGGITVSQAVLGGTSSNTVRLTVSPMTIGNTYTLTVGGVKDRFGNAVPAGTTASFTVKVVTYSDIILSDKPVAFYRFEETTGQKTVNLGTFGAAGDGLWMMGSGPTDSSPTDVSPGEGPRPNEFMGFDPANRSAKLGGPDTQMWIDTQNQFLNNLPAFSLEYWVKPANRASDPTAFGTRIGIVGQNDAVEYGFIDQNTVQIWSSGGGSLNTAYSFPDGEWHHVATIADGKSIKNYYDGALVGSTSQTTANYGSSTYNVHIGGGGVYDASGNFFTGEFDEVAIFTKAIPADRIAAHFKAGKEGGELPSQAGPVYGIGLNFGADETNGARNATLAATDFAGVPGVAQANWNNLSGASGTNTSIVASAAGSTVPTTVIVSWTCPNTWSTLGRGETNNSWTGPDQTLMLGYLDTGGNNTNTLVTIQGLPAEMTSDGYDVYVYAQGGVGAKGGGYRILDAKTMTVLKDYVQVQAPTMATTYLEAIANPDKTVWSVGNYIHFTGLNSANIIVQSVTATPLGFGNNPRAPINAIQLVAPATVPPSGVVTGPMMGVSFSAGSVRITFEGTLQSSPTITGPFQDVAGATSPYQVTPTGSAMFYRSKK